MSYNKETGMYEGFIYRIINIETEEQYVGQTTRDVDIRIREHFLVSRTSGADAHFNNINEFKSETLEKLSCNQFDELKNKLDEREKYWVNYYDSYNNGYNQTQDGRGCENGCINCSPISVLAYDRHGNFVGQYNTIHAASKATGANRTRITKSCMSGDKYALANNYIFRYINDALTDDQVNIIKNKYPLIYQYTLDGVLLNVFDSLQIAAEYLNQTYGYNVQSRNLSKVCNKDNATAYNFVWRKYPCVYNSFKVNLKKRIEQRDIITGNLINTYETLVEAAKSTGGNASYIGQIVSNRFNKYTSGGYYWCYEGEFDENDFLDMVFQHHAAVYMLNSDKQIIKSFNSIKEAHIYLNGSYDGGSNIYSVCNKNVTAYGYYWEYIMNRHQISDSAERTRNIVDET